MMEAIKRVQGVRLITPRWNRVKPEPVLVSAVSRSTNNNVVPLIPGPRPTGGQSS